MYFHVSWRVVVDKALIAQRVATKLFAAENAVDTAILEASQLLSGLIEARKEMGLSAVLGTEAVSKVSLALSTLSESRQAMVDAHNVLNDAKLRLGIRTRMDGIGPKGTAEDDLGDNVVEHRIVARRAS
jgi:hypothetical protein